MNSYEDQERPFEELVPTVDRLEQGRIRAC